LRGMPAVLASDFVHSTFPSHQAALVARFNQIERI